MTNFKSIGVESPAKVAAALTKLWSPRVIAEVEDAYIKVAKVKGELTWHAHAEEDELFYILKGQLKLEMEAQTVTLNEGEMYVVPKGVRHNPIADEECHLMLIERKTTEHTGDVVINATVPIAGQVSRD